MSQIYHFNWSGAHISLNKWYSASHWTLRYEHKHEWHTIFKPLIKEQSVPKINQYKIELIYNSRLDPTNTITMVKLFEDTLKEMGIIEDDNKHFCKGVALTPDLTRKDKVYTIKLTALE
jgi:hypothetical protein